MTEEGIARRLVLDTNVVLDWLVFRDDSVAVLRDDLERGRARVVSSDLTMEELRRVLAYSQFRLDASRQIEVAHTYEQFAERASLPEGFAASSLMLPETFPRCRDADNQHFLALAYHARADALVSKDKAVLKLRRRARRFGVQILTIPELETLAR